MVDDPLSISRLLISDSNEQEKKQNFILMIFILIAIILSFVLSLYIILIYIFYPKTRNFAFKMVLYLNIADCNFSIAQLLVFANPNFLFDYPTTNSDVICKIQSLMITWFGLSCIIWTSIIAWTLYSTVILNSTNIEDKEGKYITFGFLIPLIASLLPFFRDDYGFNGHFCWFRNTPSLSKESFLEIVFLYLELWIASIFNTIIIYKVISFLRFAGITSDRSWVLKLRFYPLILIFCWSWGTVIKIKDLIDSGNEKKNIDWLSFLNFFFCSLQGTFNAIIYGINSSVKKIIKSHFRFFLFWREKRKLENIKEMTGGVEMRGSFVKNTRAESISSAWSYENERNSIDMSQIDRTINMKEIAEYVLE